MLFPYQALGQGDASEPVQMTDTEADVATEADSDTAMEADSDMATETDSDTATTADTEERVPGPSSRRWYIYLNHKTSGPFKESKMKEMIANGTLLPDTKIAAAGASVWVLARTAFDFSVAPLPRPMLTAVSSPEPTPQNAVVDKLLKIKSRNVMTGNVVTIAGMVGVSLAMVIGADVLYGNLEGDDMMLMMSGFLAFTFGGLRLSGAVTSTVAATRYNRLAGKPAFSSALFYGGLMSGLIGYVVSATLIYQGIRDAEDFDDDEKGYIDKALQKAGWTVLVAELLRNVLWSLNVYNAKKATLAHRVIAPKRKRVVGIAPMVIPKTGSYGIWTGVQF
ncbi:MAG: DUF4339 domain-containing protein [Deltaproteobacteria bacterium]|nr:DUF4339 domain-containing protein [Deltaproteobacteria bacterium]